MRATYAYFIRDDRYDDEGVEIIDEIEVELWHGARVVSVNKNSVGWSKEPSLIAEAQTWWEEKHGEEPIS